MDDSATPRIESEKKPLVIAAVVAAAVALATFNSLTGPLLGRPNSALAKQTVTALFTDPSAVSTAGLVAIAALGAVLLIKPLVVTGALSLMEMMLFARSRRRRDFLLIWTMQFSIVGFGATFSALTQFHGLPGPMLGSTSRDLSAFSLAALPFLFAFLFIYDFIFYWLHRALHAFPWLWKFHSVHHAQDLDAAHNVVHPFEQMLVTLLVAIPTLIIVRPPGEQIYVLAIFLTLQVSLTHSVLPVHLGPLRLLFCDNRYHFIHHSRDAEHYNTNFVMRFPIIDMMFGTYCTPTNKLLAQTGLDDRGPPPTFWRYVIADLPKRAPSTDRPVEDRSPVESTGGTAVQPA